MRVLSDTSEGLYEAKIKAIKKPKKIWMRSNSIGNNKQLKLCMVAA